MPGDRYGMWTIVKEVERYYIPSGRPLRRFLCKCDCGTLREILLGTLRAPTLRSCGCAKKKKKSQPWTAAPLGVKYGKLTVTKEVDPILNKNNHNTRYVLCKCDCGNEKVASIHSLKSGNTKSCGCLGINIYYNQHLYLTWSGMKTRCYDKTSRAAKYYLNRGITICEEWRNSYNVFAEWALSHGWKKGLQIDRIDNDGNYTPNNCRFVTPSQNTRNRSCSVLYDFHGENIVLLEILERLGRECDYVYLLGRISHGWTLEEALSIPKGMARKKYYNLKKEQ